MDNAHESITAPYLDRYKPQVIMFDDRFTRWVPDASGYRA